MATTIQNILIASIVLLVLFYLSIFPKCYNQFQVVSILFSKQFIILNIIIIIRLDQLVHLFY